MPPASTSDLFMSGIAAALAPHKRVLIAGAGGGFDVFAGLPMFFALRDAGKEVFLANLSFTYLGGSQAQRLSQVLWRVDHEVSGDLSYFPERFLAEFLHQNGYPSAVYAFDKVGVRPLRAAYEALTNDLGLDALVLVDGGTDILMRGDEAGLGTPAEDMTSLAATRDLPLAKFVSCLGFGIDAFHGVCHAHFLENVAELERAGGYLGAHSIHLSHPSVSRFRDAVEYAHAKMPHRQSIVNGSILSALEGRFGNHQRTDRTGGSELFINPLMALYWHFDLETLASRSLYLKSLENTDTIFDVQLLIEAFRHSVTLRERKPIPV
ncbi:MAG TPA: DUF1152 domain-containing protein [Polyangiaceae bacterium]|nr:DUF1152 domain-containing protein [Polyangiaceae bacterium]